MINLLRGGAIVAILALLGLGALYAYRAFQSHQVEIAKKEALLYKNRSTLKWLALARSGSNKNLSSPFEWREAAEKLPPDPKALPELFKALDERSEPKRFAMTVLSRFTGDACLDFKPQLVEALGATNPVVQEHSLMLLGKLGPAAQDVAGRIAEATAAEQDTSLRLQAVRTLGQVGGESAVGKLKEIAANTEDALFFREALESLANADAPEALAMIGPILDQPDTSEVQLIAMRVLSKCGAAGVSTLCGVLRDASPKDSNLSTALQALAELGPSAAESVPDLVALLNSPHAQVRNQVGLVLGAIAPERSDIAIDAGALAKLLREQSEPLPGEMRSHVARLKELQEGDSSHSPASEDELRIQRRVAVLYWAAEALGKRRDPAVRPELESVLDYLRKEVETMSKDPLMSVGNVRVGTLDGDTVTYEESAQTVIVDVDKYRAKERAAALEAQRDAFRSHLARLEGLSNAVQSATDY